MRKYKLINNNILERIKILQKDNRQNGRDIPELFLKEIEELRVEEDCLCNLVNRGICLEKAYQIQKEKIYKELADNIIFYLQLNKEEKEILINNSVNIKRFERWLYMEDEFLRACINYKVERTIARLGVNFYD